MLTPQPSTPQQGTQYPVTVHWSYKPLHLSQPRAQPHQRRASQVLCPFMWQVLPAPLVESAEYLVPENHSGSRPWNDCSTFSTKDASWVHGSSGQEEIVFQDAIGLKQLQRQSLETDHPHGTAQTSNWNISQVFTWKRTIFLSCSINLKSRLQVCHTHRGYRDVPGTWAERQHISSLHYPCRSSQILTNNHWVNEEINGEIKKNIWR